MRIELGENIGVRIMKKIMTLFVVSLGASFGVECLEEQIIPVSQDANLKEKRITLEQVGGMLQKYKKEGKNDHFLRSRILMDLYSLDQSGMLTDLSYRNIAKSYADDIKAGKLSVILSHPREEYKIGNLAVIPPDALRLIFVKFFEGASIEEIKRYSQINLFFNRTISSMPVNIDLSPFGKKISDKFLLKVIEGFPNLKSLNLQNARITDKAIGHLSLLSSLNSLILRDAKNITNVGFASLGIFKKLTSLNLARSKIRDSGLVNLKGLTQLQSLNLGGTKITDAGLKNLESLININELQLWSTKITNKGLEFLTGLKNIHTLGLGGSRITNAGLIYLAPLVNLKELNLARNGINGKGLKALETLVNLGVLHLGGGGLKDVDLEFLKPLKNLHSLKLEETDITGLGLKHLVSLKNIRSLSLGNTYITDENCQNLELFENLQFLDLIGCEITDESLDSLMALINLNKLHIWGTRITFQGKKLLMLALPDTEIF